MVNFAPRGPFVIEIEIDLVETKSTALQGREVAPPNGVQISYLMPIDLNAI